MADLLISGANSGAPAQANDLIPIVRGTTPFSLNLGNVQTLVLNVPATTGSTVGVVNKAGATWLHNFKPAANDGNNLFIGLNAGNFTMGGATSYLGSNNVAVGDSALRHNTTGYDNTAVGYMALTANTTGYWNTAVGMDCMRDMVSGIENTGLGEDVMPSMLTGDYNVAVGGDIMYNATTGDANVAVGIDAMTYSNGANNNVAVGKSALTTNVTGAGNVVVGFHAGYNLLGSNNVAIGNGALYANNAYNHTAIGSGAGYTNPSGYGCVFIGFDAGYYETGNQRLFIDNAPRTNEATARTQAMIYGIFNAAVASQQITFNCGSMGFFAHVAAAQPTKAGHNNWAALSDVVSALVSIGIFDAA